MRRVVKMAIVLGIWGVWGVWGVWGGARANIDDLDPIRGIPGSGYQAEGVVDPANTIERILSNVIGFLTITAGITFALYVVLAGLTWITAREESERISKSKQMLTNALVGLAIVAASWALTGVLETVFGFNILSPGELIKQIMPTSEPPGGGGSPTCAPGEPC